MIQLAVNPHQQKTLEDVSCGQFFFFNSDPNTVCRKHRFSTRNGSLSFFIRLQDRQSWDLTKDFSHSPVTILPEGSTITITIDKKGCC